MKKVLTFVICCLTFTIFAQTNIPQAVNFQAVVRDDAGNLVTNKNIQVQLSIYDDVPTGGGVVIWCNTYEKETNAYGSFSVNLNNEPLPIATQCNFATLSSFEDIPWENGDMWLRIEFKDTIGTPFEPLGDIKLTSAFYALACETCGTSDTALVATNATYTQTLADLDGDTKIQVEGGPDEDTIRFDIKGTEYFVMHDSGHLEIVNTGESVFIGEGTGTKDDLSQNQHTFVGYEAGKNVEPTDQFGTGVAKNTALGWGALSKRAANGQNVAVGYSALEYNEGLRNVGCGAHALAGESSSTNTGGYNVALGFASLEKNTSGKKNVGVGMEALFQNSTGDFNVAIGFRALYFNAGEHNTAIGYEANQGGGAYNNTTAIGYGAVINGSNEIRLGNSSITNIEGEVPFTATSDARVKNNVQEDIKGLEFITRLRPVTYNFDVDKQNELTGAEIADFEGKYDIEKIKFSGFLAQEVESSAREVGYDFSGIKKPSGDKDIYGLRYAEFVVPLVKATQEQQEIITTQAERIEELEAKNKSREEELKLLKTQQAELLKAFEMLQSELEEKNKSNQTNR